ncbi:MAG: hypothetical protein ACKO66_09060 [Flavobacteriales bacterium]
MDHLIKARFSFQRFDEYLRSPLDRVVMLRHDVDARNQNSLRFAQIQHALGIRGTYYFRMVKGSFDRRIIEEMLRLGHEIGYHYEDMDFANGHPERAVALFEKHLAQLREVAPIQTLCMHGSPRSAYDNKDIWKHIRYQDYALIGEPYYDLNFNEVFYLTDTGRRWDGLKYSVRDKVSHDGEWPTFHSTHDICEATKRDQFPSKIMFNFHPQRWDDGLIPWAKEFVFQSAKNQIKKVLFVKR